MDDLEAAPSPRTRKRQRTSHACDTCRARKIRCDGNQPCTACSAAQIDCAYGSEASTRGKTDLILEGILRLEESITELKTNLPPPYSTRNHEPSPLQSSNHVFLGSPSGEKTWSAGNRQSTSTPMTHGRRDSDHDLDNAVLDAMHTSTTESILEWPQLANFHSLRANYVPTFRLEQSRPCLSTRSTVSYPFQTIDEVETVLAAFGRHVNFWYPTMSQRQLEQIRSDFMCGVPDDDSVSSCLGLLTMALGCASQVIEGISSGLDLPNDELQRRLLRKKIGDIYFEGALKKIHRAYLETNSVAVQCLLFVGLYFAFLVRPLQGWEYLNATAAKCLLLLRYAPAGEQSEEQERLRRIFWSCYIMESDYVAELAACPLSGVSQVESSVSLPGQYHTHTLDSQEEQSSLYFLACISMRRLLNRVHHLLYARGSGAAFSPAKFGRIVQELKHQLDEWRNYLPVAFAFSLDTEATETEYGGFLRQRYLTCEAVIYRPYLVWVLSGKAYPAPGGCGVAALEYSKACIDACILHIRNLKGFVHTVMVDTWICSLSMAGTMLVLLSAWQVPSLREHMGARVLDLGDHLKTLFDNWQRLSIGEGSPTVEQSIRIFGEVGGFMQEDTSPATMGF